MQVDAKRKVRVLTFVGFYLPGYKAGGPLRTLANMSDHLADSIEFWIVTRDRDQGDTASYPSVQTNAWQPVGFANVFYATPERCTVKSFADLIKSVPHDVIYLNSFFDPVFTLQPLLARRFLGASSKPVILAPRGEFSEGALRIKTLKKNIFLGLMHWLYKGIGFQASSEYEKEDILKRLPWARRSRFSVAMDLPVQMHSTPPAIDEKLSEGSVLRVVYLSRVSPMKNLDYSLAVFKYVSSNLLFDIYGPIEDVGYWSECRSVIDTLPAHIKVSYQGSVLPDQVKNTFVKYDLFMLPSRGENYGHVIAESVSVGTPVLISDQTPWRGLEQEGLGWDVSLDDPSVFAEIIDNFASLPAQERASRRHKVYAKAVERLTDKATIGANKEMFFSAISREEH